MKLTSKSFKDGGRIPEEFAFVKRNPQTHVTFSSNRNPDLSWEDAPAGTQSFVLICRDDDVPSKPDDVNKEDRVIAATAPRITFYHWLLFDIPVEVREIAAGSQSREVVAGGKPGPEAPNGYRHGVNDYTSWFAGDRTMEGTYYGYDGPCPPWNDARVHHYVFWLFALGIPRLKAAEPLRGAQIKAAMQGCVLAEATLTGTYSVNPNT